MLWNLHPIPIPNPVPNYPLLILILAGINGGEMSRKVGSSQKTENLNKQRSRHATLIYQSVFNLPKLRISKQNKKFMIFIYRMLNTYTFIQSVTKNTTHKHSGWCIYFASHEQTGANRPGHITQLDEKTKKTWWGRRGIRNWLKGTVHFDSPFSLSHFKQAEVDGKNTALSAIAFSRLIRPIKGFTAP